MKPVKITLSLFLSLLFFLPLPAQTSLKPKLVLFVAVDQFRADYLQRFRAGYSGGFNLLLTQGAVFANAQLQHYPSVTAPGHSTFLTGATPSLSGIIGNEWYDRASGKTVTSVSDESVKLIGGREGSGSSPHRLLVSTIGDELKISGQGKPRVIGISLKDRAAILMAGHMADSAVWFDPATGNFVSSTFYGSDLPSWVKEFNARRPADRFQGAECLGKKLPAAPGEKLYEAIAESPFGNQLVEEIAERAIRSELLGRRDVTDLLAVSFSSNDYVGHEYGPDSPQVKDISIRTDKLLGRLLEFADGLVGAQNVLVVLSADHGVVSVPEVNRARRMPGGRISLSALRDAVQKALAAQYGEGNWILGADGISLYLNRSLVSARKLEEPQVERSAARALFALPHVLRVFTRSELSAAPAPDPLTRRVLNGFNFRRSGDVVFVLEPYWIIGEGKGTTHGSPYTYDTHVPLIFMGPGIRAGTYYEAAAVNDIAPTLSAILGIQIPSGSAGRILSEMFR